MARISEDELDDVRARNPIADIAMGIHQAAQGRGQAGSGLSAVRRQDVKGMKRFGFEVSKKPSWAC
jgi:hypothetical protein